MITIWFHLKINTFVFLNDGVHIFIRSLPLLTLFSLRKCFHGTTCIVMLMLNQLHTDMLTATKEIKFNVAKS